MRKFVVLDADEIAELRRQAPETASDGGFQRFLVRLQSQMNYSTQELKLNDQDLADIPRFAFDYKQGGWQSRLMAIFARTLGPRLGKDDR
jgi:hypothetical protein